MNFVGLCSYDNFFVQKGASRIILSTYGNKKEPYVERGNWKILKTLRTCLFDSELLIERIKKGIKNVNKKRHDSARI